jgi:hypothetical protein
MMSLTYHASTEALVPCIIQENQNCQGVKEVQRQLEDFCIRSTTFLEKLIWSGSEGVGEEESDYSDVEVAAFLVGSSTALEVAT